MRLVASFLVGALGVTSLAAAQTAVFSDGFESGSVCGWSDGVPLPRVYVSFTDPEATTDVSCGLDPAAPCLTITGGLVSAAVNACCEVDVAAATYDEDVELEAGVRLRGGFDPATWSRDPSTYLTTIEGTAGSGHRRAVSGRALGNGPVELEGFEIIGATATGPGANSYAVYLDLTGTTAPVTIRDNVVVAGNGGPAGAGAPGVYGADGADGGTRSDDPAAYDAFMAIGSGACDPSNDRSYANGGPSSCGGDGLSGGAGGGNQCAPVHSEQASGLAGGVGGGAAGGAGGGAGYDMELDSGPLCYFPILPDGTVPPIDGADGSTGGAGGDRAGGGGCSAPAGAVVAGDWVGGAAAPGSDGADGSGGGGGGGGGGASCNLCSSGEDQLGGLGGGGGGGGCGGTGGGGGGSGGGSFGIFVVGLQPPTITGNRIILGTGGAGGSGGPGGPGGYGGLGGFGGYGNRVLYCTGAGGRGGDGGDGGSGGGGGGGCGGASFGIYTAGLGAPGYCSGPAGNVFEGGGGGAAGGGGSSPGNAGGDGQDGATAGCSFN